MREEFFKRFLLASYIYVYTSTRSISSQTTIFFFIYTYMTQLFFLKYIFFPPVFRLFQDDFPLMHFIPFTATLSLPLLIHGKHEKNILIFKFHSLGISLSAKKKKYKFLTLARFSKENTLYYSRKKNSNRKQQTNKK